MTKARDIASAAPAPSTVSATELGYLDGVTSAIQTQLDAKTAKSTLTTTGDIYYASAANTPARLGIGTASQLLAVNSGATAPEWVAAPASGGMTLISTTTLSGASVTLSSIPATYKNLQLVIRNLKPSVDGENIQWRINGDSTANRHRSVFSIIAANQSFNDTLCSTAYSNDNSVDSGIVVVNFFDYANTTTWKMMESQELLVNLTTTTNFNYGIGQHGYNQTGAISSLVLFPNSGNFTSGTALLYGVS
jgi:hypothetical protein